MLVRVADDEDDPHRSHRGNAEQKLSTIKDAIEGLLNSDKTITLTIADEGSMLSPKAADRLGFSRQHVRRLIEAGELEGEKLPNSTHWKIPLRHLGFRGASAYERAAERLQEAQGRLG